MPARTWLPAELSAKQTGILGLAPDRPGLLGALAVLGVAPDDVDVVVNTHLHADHCGGNTRLLDDALVPTFPRARYLVQRIEYAEASFPNERTRATYLAENLEPVAAAGQWDLLKSDTQVSPHVRTVVTRGHTQGHQCVVVEPSAGPPIVFLADLAPKAVHLERIAWVPAVDVLPLDSLVTKRAMAEWVVRHHAACVFEHDEATPVGRLERDGQRYAVTGVELPAPAP